jgi:AraC family transcriptional regulator of adaptative response/methylated-DNA-[protein]-cysteine methyltransferase
MNSEQSTLDYQRIENAITFISDHSSDQPSLEQVAAHVHLSPTHFQRLFTRWAGISPKKFLQFINLRDARERLRNNLSLAEVAHEAGLSGTGRLHDLFITFEGMTPYQYGQFGSGLRLHYGFHNSPFGNYLLSIADQERICTMDFVMDERLALGSLQEQWKNSTLIHSQEKTGRIASRIFSPTSPEPVRLLARGTPYQLKVWEALLKIPFGEMVPYQMIAEHVGKPKGLQAVGGAIGKNPIAYLIPCHRVVRKTGQISEYRWGAPRKKAMLGWEAAQLQRAH